METCNPQPMTFRWLNDTCDECGQQLSTWDQRCRTATGTRDKLCENCLAKRYGKTTKEFRTLMEDYFDMRPCKGAV